MTKFFNISYFWPIFPVVGAKQIFQKNPALSSTTSNGFLAPCQHLDKTNDQSPRIHLGRWT